MAKRYANKRRSYRSAARNRSGNSGMRRGNAQRVVLEIHHVAGVGGSGLSAGGISPVIDSTTGAVTGFQKPAASEPGRGKF